MGDSTNFSIWREALGWVGREYLKALGYRFEPPAPWRCRPFEKWYEASTPFGFNLSCKVEGFIRRVNDAAYKVAEMSVEDPGEAALSDWGRDVLADALGSWFFKLDFVNLHSMKAAHVAPFVVSCLKAGPAKDGGSTRSSLGLITRSDVVREVNRIREKHGWRSRGCEVDLYNFSCGMSAEQIRENYAMLTEDQIAEAGIDVRMLRCTEVAAAAAMKQWCELDESLLRAQRERNIENEDLKLMTRGLDTRQSIKWSKQGICRNERWEVVGYRDTGGHSDDPFGETDAPGRVRIVHSRLANDETVDHLESGQTYYYTFFVRNSDAGENRSFLRFNVRAPAVREVRDDLRELKAAIDLLQQPRQSPAAQPRDLRAEVAEVGEQFVGGTIAFDEWVLTKEKQLRKDFNGRGFSEDEIDWLVARFRGGLAAARDEINKKVSRL